MTRTRTRIWAATGVAIGLVGGAGAGMVLGIPGLSSAATATVVEQVDEPADDTPTSATTGEPDAPPRPDVDRAGRLRSMLDDLVADGTITAEQADAVADHLAENAPHRGDRPGRRGPGLHGGGEVVADVIGIDVEALREQMRSGSSLAEIAAENGVDPQAVVDALVAQATERIDEAVESGRIEAAVAEEKLAELEERVTAHVNGDRPGN